jgi:hypothetical protein
VAAGCVTGSIGAAAVVGPVAVVAGAVAVVAGGVDVVAGAVAGWVAGGETGDGCTGRAVGRVSGGRVGRFGPGLG